MSKRKSNCEKANGVPDEYEYLFTPYYVFTIKRFEKSSKLKATPSHPHIIHLEAAFDSRMEDNDLMVLPQIVGSGTSDDDSYVQRLRNEFDHILEDEKEQTNSVTMVDVLTLNSSSSSDDDDDDDETNSDVEDEFGGGNGDDETKGADVIDDNVDQQQDNVNDNNNYNNNNDNDEDNGKKEGNN